jgi:hypothetical protein
MTARLASLPQATLATTAPSGHQRLLLAVDPACVWRWQVWLADALEAAGYSVSFAFLTTPHAFPASLRLLMTLESLLYDSTAQRASELLSEAEVKALPRTALAGAPCDLAIDFTGNADDLEGAVVLRPAFDGMTGGAGAISAALDRRGPRLGIVDSDGKLGDIGFCALEDPENFSRSLSEIFSRMAALLLSTACNTTQAPDAGGTTMPSQAEGAPVTTSVIAPAMFLFTSIGVKAAARLNGLLGQAPHWSIAWRRCNGASAQETLRIPWEDFTRLPNDSERYCADPFVMIRGGVAHVFCEEVPLATCRGIISHFTIDETGRVSALRPVLERPYHLSYPFVFERNGEVWMIPESSANRTVELYRAERFPDRWVKEAVLLEDVYADDATLLEKDGHFWLFASIRDWQASSWDTLGLFHAPSLLGPWQAHPANPVLLDPSAARPGGAIFWRQNRLIRPAQDCKRAYGAGLAFCRIDRLDEEHFEQSILTQILPRTGRVEGLHTYNRAGDIEVIDLFGAA